MGDPTKEAERAWDMVTYDVIDFLRTLATGHSVALAERFEAELDRHEARTPGGTHTSPDNSADAGMKKRAREVGS